MSDFEYGNARLKAMKSRLLSRVALEELAETRHIAGLITALAETAYREAVNAALLRLSGMDCLAEALRNHLKATVRKAGCFFSGSAGELARLALGRYDLHNLKTVLRGLTSHAPPNEILANSLPVGELRAADLAELARAPSASAAIDLLATWRIAWAQPLLPARAAARAGATELFRLELALERWYLDNALRQLSGAAETGRALREALLLEADVANVLTVLRLAGAPAAAGARRGRFGADGIADALVGPGHIPVAVLAAAAQKETPAAVVGALAGTPYHALLAEALESYAATPRLSLFERALRRRQLACAASGLAGDPLGIGVLVGFVALQTNEVGNLRAVAQGIELGEQPEAIRGEFVFAE
jgi:V/A-type H+-transporting ATPase subunit C